MDTQEVEKQLKAARSAIENALRVIRQGNVAAVKEMEAAYKSESICMWCGDPILPEDETMRGRHISCYNQIYAKFIRTKKKTMAELEKEGLLDPPAKTGRPEVDIEAKALAAKDRIRQKRNKNK